MDPNQLPDYQKNSKNFSNENITQINQNNFNNTFTPLMPPITFSPHILQNKRSKLSQNDNGSVFCTQCSLHLNAYGNSASINTSDGKLFFCGEDCISVYKITNRRAVKCQGCGSKKSIKNMICHGKDRYFCSIECLNFAKPARGRPPKRGRLGKFGHSRLNSPNKHCKRSTDLSLPSLKNKSVQNEMQAFNKSVICKPISCDVFTQTELDFNSLETTVLPIPVPFHQILPMCLYKEEVPLTLLVPIPIPVPIPFTTAPPLLKEVKFDNRFPTKIEDPRHPSLMQRTFSFTQPIANEVIRRNIIPSSWNGLQHSYGVNAWNNWRNSSIDGMSRSGVAYPDLTYSTPPLLNEGLCHFIQEIKKPTGEQYAPDSVYYLCLGIQKHIIECGRPDNIFSDSGDYRSFTDLMDSILKEWEPLLNQNGQLICRIQEEHLWETRQIGIHSPQVVLNTILYFNTKYFLLRSSDEHLKLSFSNIIKQSRRVLQPNPSKDQLSGYNSSQSTRQLCLCYYPTNSSHSDNSRLLSGDEVLEQPENTTDHSRCPLKIYDFYLSKCPSGVRSRSDLFYLKPDISSNQNSPIWFLPEPMNPRDIDKMMRRVLLVKEIQEAFFTRQGRFCLL